MGFLILSGHGNSFKQNLLNVAANVKVNPSKQLMNLKKKKMCTITYYRDLPGQCGEWGRTAFPAGDTEEVGSSRDGKSPSHLYTTLFANERSTRWSLRQNHKQTNREITEEGIFLFIKLI